MRKSLLLIFAAAALALGAIALLKGPRSEPSDSEDPAQQMRKNRIKAFWEAYNRATELRSQGEFAQAIRFYKRALELDPNHEDSLYYLGNCLLELGHYTEAVKVYRRITELNPNSHRGFSQLGIALSTLAPGAPLDPAQAKAAFERNAQINREESGPFLRLGLLALNEGNLEEALRYFNTAAGFRSPEGCFLAGYVRFRQQRYREAIDLFQRVLEINAREKRITGRGVLSEGDIKPSASQIVSTPLEAAGIKSLMYLYWAAAKIGGYPPQVGEEFRIKGRGDSAGLKVVDVTSKVGLARGDMGRGAWADYDKDGDMDLAVVTRNSTFRLYRNEGGKFADVAKSTGLAGAGDAWGICWGDYDGDGYEDLYVVRPGFIGSGENALYRNNGNGAFVDATKEAGLGGKRATARALFLDYNGDGKLDILEVGNAEAGQPPLRLFRNEGGRRFRQVSEEARIVSEGNAVDCAVGDYDGDGLADLFLLRWRRPVILYHNNGDGTFADVTSQARLSGVGGDGFSALFFDYDKDGRLDLLVTSHAPYDMAIRCLIRPDFTSNRHTPRLFRNNGDGSFDDVTENVGLNRCYGVMQAIDIDIDRDGWLDLIFACGGLDGYRLEPSLVLRNLGGKRFSEQLYLPAFDAPSNSLGVAVADFDLDGGTDLYVSGCGLYSVQAR